MRFVLAVVASASLWITVERPAHADTDFSVAITFVTSVHQADLGELNEELAASGHTPLSERDILPGMGICGSFSRFRFGWDIGLGFSRELKHEPTGWAGDVFQLQTFFDAGYDVFRRDGWVIAGHGGVGLSKFSLDAMASHPPFSEGAFHPQADDTTLEKSSGLVRAAMGLTYYYQTLTPSRPHDRTKTDGPLLSFDLRAGYQQSFSMGGWNDLYGDAALGSSPRVDLSGPFMMFSVGVGGGSVDFGAAKDVCGLPPDHGVWQARGLSCVPACFERFGDCDSVPDNGCEASFDTDPLHCGGCDEACDLLHAQSGCQQGRCVPKLCESGWGDCDGRPENGCESPLAESRDHCGQCGHRCLDGEACQSGACAETPPVQIAQ